MHVRYKTFIILKYKLCSTHTELNAFSKSDEMKQKLANEQNTPFNAHLKVSPNIQMPK